MSSAWGKPYDTEVAYYKKTRNSFLLFKFSIKYFR